MQRRWLVATGGSLITVACLLGILVVLLPQGATNGFDAAWNTAMAEIRQPWMLAAAHALNRIGGGWVATVLVPVLIGVLMIVLRRWRAAVYAAIAFVASAALVQLLKEIYARARPDDMLVSSDFGSFPSGHAANAATIATVLWIVFPRVWVAVAGILWTVAMALSRTLLSVHWITDTIGGAMVGAGAALVVAAAVLAWASLGWQRPESTGGPLAAEGKAPVSLIRPYRPSDRESLYDVCVKTADAGGDATGLFTDDRLWGDVFAVPYAERHPDLCWVVESADGRTVGYVVATDDTDAFERWFRDEWWPTRAENYPLSGEDPPTRQDGIILYASRRGPARETHARDYPAHLHIDLLPETQGQGLGRRLVETLFEELRRRGVAGLHLGMNPENNGAGAFYERLGMHRLDSDPDTVMYGVRFDGAPFAVPNARPPVDRTACRRR
ncbi:GNAT family N-acetyltransferase [Microbacterium sp.]|uniref:GNAT family N-acetyltransferase n=1 Tax=Microbacterium sp. TaxID=51671 RepID=UPI002812284F|nr:GNAT family N-acetyltransferase [Microbacterium sp.]